MIRNETAREVFVAAVAAGQTLAAAAESAGVSLSTVKRWHTEPETREQIAAARAELIARFSDRITTTAHRALDVIETVMDDPQATPGTRLRAAATILGHFIPVREHAVMEARLEALEAAAATDRTP